MERNIDLDDVLNEFNLNIANALTGFIKLQIADALDINETLDALIVEASGEIIQPGVEAAVNDIVALMGELAGIDLGTVGNLQALVDDVGALISDIGSLPITDFTSAVSALEKIQQAGLSLNDIGSLQTGVSYGGHAGIDGIQFTEAELSALDGTSFGVNFALSFAYNQFLSSEVLSNAPNEQAAMIASIAGQILSVVFSFIPYIGSVFGQFLGEGLVTMIANILQFNIDNDPKAYGYLVFDEDLGEFV
ncbi:MAG: hypothetical protein AAF581_21130, partial [Planctomycetota bacterium]